MGKSLHQHWGTADGNTEKVEGKITFGQRLESKGYVKGKTRDKNPFRVWEGLRLKPGY